MNEWTWTFVWCGVCDEQIVPLGRRRIKHTDPRPECIYCTVRRVLESIRAQVISPEQARSVMGL